MILRAAETARSLFEPTIKLSRVYFWLSPVSVVVVVLVVFLILLIWFLMEVLDLVTSRGRDLVLLLLCTSKSIFVTVRLLFSRDFLMRSEYLLRSCLTKKVFLTPIMIRPSSVEISEVSWNQVEKFAVDICCSISASAFFQTSYI